MKNFEEIIAKIARENGTTPENVLREMQLAIDHAYDHQTMMFEGKEKVMGYDVIQKRQTDTGRVHLSGGNDAG